MPNEQKVKVRKFYQNSSRPSNYVPNALVTSPPEYPPLMSGLMQINPETKDIWISAGREFLSDWINITAGGGGGGGVTSIDVNGGTGISVTPAGPITTSGAFTVVNTAPDLVVSLTAGTGIGVTGVYPSFTISSTAYNTIQEDGSGLTSRSTVNFVGTGVTATDDGGNLRTNVTIPGITASEGLSVVTGDPNDIELGRSALAATADFSVARYINAGTNTINISGNKVALTSHPYTADTSPAVIRGINTSANLVTQRSIGVLGSSAGDFAYGVYGSATGASGIGVYGINTTGAAGIGLWGEATQSGVWGKGSGVNAYGVYGQANSLTRSAVFGQQDNVSGYAIEGYKGAATSGQISPVIRLDVGSAGNVGANGQGSSIDFRCATVTGNNPKTQVKLGSWWSNATTASSTANFTIYVADAGAAPSANITFAGNGGIQLGKTLPTSSVGLNSGDLYTQTATELGGSGAQKVICVV